MPAACALIVEDEPDLRENIAELLESEGYGVSTAKNGREALDLLAGQRPDIILLDLNMPVMSGWEVVDHMRHDDQLRRIPVLVISAHPHPPPDVAVLTKPFEVPEMLATIRAMVHPA